MALHEIPKDGAKHLHVRDCPCNPTASRRRHDGMMRTVYTHRETRKHPEMAPLVVDVAANLGDPDDLAGPEDPECGHVLVDVDGETHHHDIPDDGAPHAPTSECGCGPQRETAGGHVVYGHVDQDADVDEREEAMSV